MRVSGTSAAAIAASIEKQVVAGAVGPEETLPTVRDLATSLRVSPATVAAAYKLLRGRGLAVGQGRRGTRLASAGRVQGPLPGPQTVEVAAAGMDLATGNPDPALLPPVEGALRAITALHEPYSPTPDRALLAFAAAEFDADGIPAGSIAVLGGALDAIERVLREHTRVGDRVGVEDPSFPGVLDLVSATGLAPVPIAMDGEGPLPDGMKQALAKGCRAVIVTPRAQNPTGAAIGAGRADALRTLLRRHPDVVLIENDYLSAVAGAPAVTLSGSLKHWVAIRSTSKFLGPDLRVALMAGDALTVARVQGRHALGPRWVSRILQRLVVALWSDPAGGRRLARAAETYAARRTALVEALAARDIHVIGRSGFNLWLPTRDEAHLVSALSDRGWAVAPGARFRVQAPPGIRITTSMLDPGDAGRLAAAVAESVDLRAAVLA